MGLGISPLRMNIMLESNPLTSRTVVRRLAARLYRGHCSKFHESKSRDLKARGSCLRVGVHLEPNIPLRKLNVQRGGEASFADCSFQN